MLTTQDVEERVVCIKVQPPQLLIGGLAARRRLPRRQPPLPERGVHGACAVGEGEGGGWERGGGGVKAGCRVVAGGDEAPVRRVFDRVVRLGLHEQRSVVSSLGLAMGSHRRGGREWWLQWYGA